VQPLSTKKEFFWDPRKEKLFSGHYSKQNNNVGLKPNDDAQISNKNY
jgi:hypothetical protein